MIVGAKLQIACIRLKQDCSHDFPFWTKFGKLDTSSYSMGSGSGGVNLLNSHLCGLLADF